MVKGASAGEGLGNKFLSHIREVDAIVHVVRCFDDKNITHVSDKVDPLADIDIINTELALADLDTVSKRKDKAEKLIETGDKKYADEAAVLAKLYDALSEGKPARSVKLGDAETKSQRLSFCLPTSPLFIVPISEKAISKR